MSITAARLGSSPITLDWTHLTPSYSVDPEAFAEAWEKLKNRFNGGEVGFFDAPVQNSLSQAEESQAMAQSLLQRKQFSDCLFLGIGGSALGPIALLSALQEKCVSGIRFHFVENPDPVDWKSTLGRLNPSSTLVCVVTKSGTTFETLALLLNALDWLGREKWKTNVLVITDPEKGDLKTFATRQELPTLSIAPSIGGRFSVFTPVGLFAAAFAGLSVIDFLQGAKQVRDAVLKAPLEKNPLFILGSELLRFAAKRPIHVCMPYSTRLKLTSAWFVQLWGESLGKEGKGFTPLAAVGATDQHSILQLLRDGPDDKVTFFITVDQVQDEIKIPRLASPASVLPSFKMLEGHSLQELLTIEYRATCQVLTKQNRPNLTFHLDRLDERSMGALFFSLAVLTAFTGTLWNVDPFNQPGVEEGKVYIRDALKT